MKFDHVAVNVTDVVRSVSWYRETLGARILYQDATWAFLEVGGVKLALTLAKQHPGHIAFDVGRSPSPDFLAKAKTHGDGSISRYVVDPDGNAIEYIYYPETSDKAGSSGG
jgi:catechol 2,3-dioxygenase-like lactoylglutathione lyase family enzyme